MTLARKLLYGAIQLFFYLNLSAQVQEESDKKHFELKGNLSATEMTRVQDAVKSFGLIDVYRFDNQRRTIPFAHSDLSVILYSNQELGKPTGNHKRMALQIATPVANPKFDISTNGQIKVIATH